MSHSIENSVLKSLIKSTLSVLLNDVNTRDNCEQLDLVKELDERIERLRQRSNNKLLTCLMHIKSAVIDLNTGTEYLNYAGWASEENVQLQREVSQIKLSPKFEKAMNYLKYSKDISAEVFKNENERETKITATKIRVVSEILGNLTNLIEAAEKCEEYILEVHKTIEIRGSPFPTWYKALSYVKLGKIFESQEMKDLESAMHINAVVFRFKKKFIKAPIVMLNWSTIDIATLVNQNRLHHPILGVQPPKNNKPDPFFTFDKDVIAAFQISAVNCNREVIMAAKNPPTEISRITPSGIKNDVVDEQQNVIILSIAIDCVDCSTVNVTEPTTSQETSVQSSLASFSLLHSSCKGSEYILTAVQDSKPVQYFLYANSMNADGVVRHNEELNFMQSAELVQAKIFCMEQKKLIVFNVTKKMVHICCNQGKQLGTIDLSKELRYTYFRKPTIFTISYNGEIICSEGRSKLAIYNIEDDGSLRKANELIEVKYVVQAVAFNHESDELVILCYTSVLFEYHLAIYTKDGELKRDIKLQNGSYRDAKLIFNRNGRVVLLDAGKYLHLK